LIPVRVTSSPAFASGLDVPVTFGADSAFDLNSNSHVPVHLADSTTLYFTYTT
jgi:hypothetical protein